MMSETHFVFQIGPIPVKDGDVLAFFVEPGNPDARTFMADDARTGLEQIAKVYAGAALECEPELAPVAAEFGIQPGVLTDERKHVIGIIAFEMAFGDLLIGIEHPGIVYQFGVAASAFWRAAPWRHTAVRRIAVEFTGSASGTFEGMLMGGDLRFGLSLYPRAGTIDRLVALTAADRLEEAGRVDSLITTFDDNPAYAVDAMRRAYDVPRLPVPMRMADGRGVRLSDEDLLRLAAALKAASFLNDEVRASTSTVRVGDLSITAVARATALVSKE